MTQKPSWLRRATTVIVAGTAIANVVMPASALAQSTETRFEITPWAGYRVGGRFDETDGGAEFDLQESNTWGLSINGAVRSDAEWELLYAEQTTSIDVSGPIALPVGLDVDVQYLQVGGTLLFDGEHARPFIALTVGASRFDPTPGNYNSKTFLSGSFGGGWKIGLSDNFALRLEGRVYATLLEDNNSLFCESSGGSGSCLIFVDGDLLAQWEARAGLTVRF